MHKKNSKMNKRVLKIGFFATILIVGMSSVMVNDRLFEISKNIELFVSVFKEVNKHYVDEVDPSELMKKGIDAMVGSLDPYTNYITESQVERYRISEDDKFQGIGADVYKIEDKAYLANMLEGGAAVNGGLAAGDEIVSINGEAIKAKTAKEIQDMLRGTAGTPVRLIVNKLNGKTETVSVERDEVNIPNVPYAGMLKDGIGYVRLTTFTDNASANISKEIQKMRREAGDSSALKGIVIDLRHNGGGLLREAIQICNLFIPRGEEVVFTKGKVKEADQNYKTMSNPLDVDLPIAVMIDKRSASASEIVSGVLQDKDRGVLIGQRSFGKGLVQNVFELGYNSRVKVTISKYYIPSGRCIQGVEYANGDPVDIPDSKRSKFKTKNGRTVLDGGGVSPDIKIELKELSTLTKALNDQHLIFQYVNNYVKKNDSLKTMTNFTFTDFDGFVSFLKSKKFDYKVEGENELENLKKVVEANPNLKASLSPEIASLATKIKEIKAAALPANKNEILVEIEKEIVSRYFYVKGKTQHQLRRDNEVDEAIAVLKDPKKYKSLLGFK
jgi:carboxyl-terminal processing protease